MLRHIKTKILIFLLPVVVLSMLLNYFLSTKIGEDIFYREIEDKTMYADRLKSADIEKLLNEIDSLSISMVAMVENTINKSLFENYNAVVTAVMEQNSNMTGIGVVLEPYVLGEDIAYSATYAQKEEDGLIHSYTEYEEGVYSFYNREYYELAKNNDGLNFTEPYLDTTQGMEIITTSRAIKDKQGNFIGCVLIKFQLNELTELLLANIQGGGDLFIFDQEGYVITKSNQIFAENVNSLFDIEDMNFRETYVPFFMDNEEGNFRFRNQGTIYNVYFSNVENFDWKIAYVVSDSELKEAFSDALSYFGFITLGLVIIVIFIIVNLIHRNVEVPINIIIQQFNEIAKNEYTLDIPPFLKMRKDEFGHLGNELLQMKIQINTFQKDLEYAVNENLAFAEETIVQNENLQNSENQLAEILNHKHAILNALPDEVIIVTNQGKIIEVQGKQASKFNDNSQSVGNHISVILKSDELVAQVMDKITKVSTLNCTEVMELILETGGLFEEHFELRFAKCGEDQVVVLSRELSEFHEQRNKINYLSNYDQLTGLLNRANLRRIANETLKAGVFPFTFMVAEINGLKLMNSSFGFLAGDTYIKELADVFLQSDLTNKVLGYFGSGEFVVLIKNAEEEIVESYITEIKEECKKHYVKGINVTVSFGYFCINNSHITIDYAVNKAEKNLIIDKRKEYGSTNTNTIEIINRTLQAKSPREQFHSDRVASLCRKFAMVYGFSKEEQNEMHTAGLLHDIGKIGIPENILDKPGKLTEEEFSEMRRHPEIGHKILEASGNMREIANVIVSHHERWDGKGYPSNLKGEEIPLRARMIAIIDTFDAMVSDRSYRKGLPVEVAVEELLRCKGTQFDPELVDIFIHQVIDTKED